MRDSKSERGYSSSLPNSGPASGVSILTSPPRAFRMFENLSQSSNEVLRSSRTTAVGVPPQLEMENAFVR